MRNTHLDPAVTSSATATILRCHLRLRTRSMRRSLKWNFIVNNGAYSQPSDSAAFLIWSKITNQYITRFTYQWRIQTFHLGRGGEPRDAEVAKVEHWTRVDQGAEGTRRGGMWEGVSPPHWGWGLCPLHKKFFQSRIWEKVPDGSNQDYCHRQA